MTMDELAQFLEINDLVSDVFSDEMIQNYYEYEEGAEPIIRDRLKSALPFWKNVVKAPERILNVIENGFCIDFFVEPPRIFKDNNKSALQHADFVNKAIEDLLATKCIEISESVPYCVSPLSVAKNQEKLRLILDLSALNGCIRYEKMRLEDHFTFYDLAKYCKMVAAFDIKSCYHQISMHKDFVKYLGFKWYYQGKWTYFVFLVVPFGLTSAPRICKDLFRPLVTKWRSEGIIIVLFYDDGAIGGADRRECERFSKIVFSDLMQAHVLPNKDKSEWKPCKAITWLGYYWDFNDYTVKVSDRRVATLKSRISKVMDLLPFVTARQMSNVVGSLVSMILVLGQKCLLYSRFCQNVINYKHHNELGWDTKLNVEKIDFGFKVSDELKFLLEHFDSLNSKSFFLDLRPHRLIFSDAGENACGGYLMEKKEKKVFHTNLPMRYIGTSSTERELYSMKRALLTFGPELKNSRTLLVTDSQCSEIIVKKGSSKLNLHSLAIEIDDLARKFNIDFHVTWCKRELNQEADAISKIFDPDDWEVSHEFFCKVEILAKKRFTCDLFASEANTKCKKFYSMYHCPKSLGANAFLYPWKNEMYWICPPPVHALKAVRHLQVSKGKGVLVIPQWFSSPVWPILKHPSMKKFVVSSWIFPGRRFIFCKDEKSIFSNFKGNLAVFHLDFNRM